jgi:hypothetical protein
MGVMYMHTWMTAVYIDGAVHIYTYIGEWDTYTSGWGGPCTAGGPILHIYEHSALWPHLPLWPAG